MSFHVIQGDITKMETDAIVNTANAGLQMSGGVCGQIFRVAGEEAMQEACNRYGYCSAGKAVITPGFALPARYVIHTVGPKWYGGNQGEKLQLYNAYWSALKLTAVYKITSIAFPLLSSGNFGFPKKQAMLVAEEAIGQYLKERQKQLEVYLVLHDWEAIKIGTMLFGELEDRRNR